jgi:tetratricopeptide (TPR) repeat protein
MNCFNQVLTLDPEQDEARLHLADSLLQIEQPQEALRHLQWLAERQPSNVAAQLSLARCRSDLGQWEKARHLLDALLIAHPQNGLALIERGKVSLRMNQLPEAEKRLRKAMAVAGHELLANELLSQCLEARGKKDEAQHYRAEAERISADCKRIEELNKQIAEAPGDASARCEMGTILLHRGREQEGLAWLTSALQEDSQYRPAQKALADYYRHTRRGEVPRESSAVMSLP